jgi:zinc/manganese transport system substrate-binding protein
MTKSILAGLLLALAAARCGAASLQVSALHPLMADLARQVGGERVTVFELVGEGGNPHRFEPRPADLKQMQASALVLAAGKGQEVYLSRLKDSLQARPSIWQTPKPTANASIN